MNTTEQTETLSEELSELTGSDSNPHSPTGTERYAPSKTNWKVFLGAALGTLLISLWALIAPDSASSVLGTVVAWVSQNFGWFYILTGTVVLVFIVIIAASKQGKIRLGPDHSRPQFPLFSWAAMLFAAGIGVDLMFYSVLEPVTQYYTPAQGNGESAEAARQAVVWTLFHYGLTGWGMYALMGLAFGYFAYRFNLPLSIRSALYPIIGKRIKGAAGDAVDIAALLGTIFGVATSLGIGVVQINYGLQFLFDVPQGVGVQAGLIAVSVLMAIASAVSGVDKGIRRLSELNIYLAIALLLYVLIFGDTDFLMNGLIMNMGDYLSRFPGMTLDAMAFDHPSDWMNTWTLFFWAWWVAWSPFVGLFLARISRGRTIRQFVVGTLTIPFAFILIWISIFGNSALNLIYEQKDSAFGETIMNTPEQAFYTLLAQYPGATAAAAVATFTGLLFYVTSADSGALVMSNFASTIEDPNEDGPKWMRIFWAAATGLLTLAMLLIGGIATLQSATIVFGLPFAIVLYLVMFGLWKALRVESADMASRDAAYAGVRAANRAMSIEPSSSTRSWRQRLTRSVSYPGQKATTRYLETVVSPALEEVCEALRTEGVDAIVERGVDPATTIPYVTLTEKMDGERDFTYQVYPVAWPTPSYLLNPAKTEDNYYRLEPFALTGSRGYDVYGYTKEQLIHDVLDNHERHIEFIRISGPTVEEAGSTEIIGSSVATTDWSMDFTAPQDIPVTDQEAPDKSPAEEGTK
ncbi:MULTISPECIES: choline BCCT transporter BetT [Micrococcaceae]|uniref:choline BCCT transporter BetT n=1 Tax=unclassified Kocuria TaxID=2649579 RepID=UPI001013716C|nr:MULTISPECIES: choline BCCT transporter BetT [unclassified Kocuria]